MKDTIKSCLRTPLLAVLIAGSAPAAMAADIHVRIAPPEIRVESHEPRSGYVWTSGYWRWRGDRHEWVPGHYVRERQGYHWSDGRWQHHGEYGYVWVDGRWERD